MKNIHPEVAELLFRGSLMTSSCSPSWNYLQTATCSPSWNGEHVEPQTPAVTYKVEAKPGLKNLSQFNNDMSIAWHERNSGKPRLNGIACPSCGEELLDSNPNFTLDSAPPQKAIHCSGCGYMGYRIA